MAKRPPSRDRAEPADPARAARAESLRLLTVRELSARQLRERLAQRGFDQASIDAALARLADDGTLDDARVARSRARTEIVVRGRGRLRALRQIAALGIDPAVADAAVDEVLADVDERGLVERAIDRRLGSRAGRALERPAMARLYRHLLAQGFPPGTVMAALRARSRLPAAEPTDDE